MAAPAAPVSKGQRGQLHPGAPDYHFGRFTKIHVLRVHIPIHRIRRVVVVLV